MKKYLFTILGAGAIGVGTGTAYCLSGDAENLSSLGMENLEALADNEGDSNISCFCRISCEYPVCSIMGTGAYCGTAPCTTHDANCR